MRLWPQPPRLSNLAYGRILERSGCRLLIFNHKPLDLNEPVYPRIDPNSIMDDPENPYLSVESYSWSLSGIRMADASNPLKGDAGMPKL